MRLQAREIIAEQGSSSTKSITRVTTGATTTNSSLAPGGTEVPPGMPDNRRISEIGASPDTTDVNLKHEGIEAQPHNSQTWG